MQLKISIYTALLTLVVLLWDLPILEKPWSKDYWASSCLERIFYISGQVIASSCTKLPFSQLPNKEPGQLKSGQNFSHCKKEHILKKNMKGQHRFAHLMPVKHTINILVVIEHSSDLP